ncbi:Monocarboxylate transporter [Ceraceosorus bombacis]|uniref:Monocarboxylate transporter n=1 Tax=Ceraceosorus bombacis TaxID=401625 RepID=A0A0P1BJL6_9BASI|nr:Monocarboxylate transporter [Ceraceosorus bombacis]
MLSPEENEEKAGESTSRLESKKAETTSASPLGQREADEKALGPQQTPTSDALPDVPDGGWRAWLVAIGAATTLFASFGIANSYGVFQNYYNSNRLPHETDSVVALIGAIQLFLLYGFGPLVGKIFDSYGVGVLMPLGSFCIIFSTFMLSITQPDQTYQYFLTQGLLFGLGNAMVFTPALAVLTHWFRKKRAYALGVVAAGSSLGGVIFPIVLQRLLAEKGFGWAVRACAFIALGCLTFSCLTMKTRLPLRPQPMSSFLKFIDVGGFKDIRFCLATASAFCVFYGLFNPFFFIQQYAQLQGYLLPIINACGIPARIIPGIMADRVGVLNMLVPLITASGVLVLALWLPSKGQGAIIAFAALYGLLSGGFVSLLPAYIARISPQSHYGARLGAVYSVVAIANLVGTPTAGAFLKGEPTQQKFSHLIGFTGAIVLAGALCAAGAYAIEVRDAMRRRRNSTNPQPERGFRLLKI